jgi:hypothetical protein
MAVYYCIPCGEQGRPVAATCRVDGDLMCAGHEMKQPKRLKRYDLEGKPILPRGAPMPKAARAFVPLREPAYPAGECQRGCGKPHHRGRCAYKNKGTAALPEPTPIIPSDVEPAPAAPQPTPEKKVERYMDVLVSKTMSLDDLPPDSKPPLKKLGRTGELWAKLLELQPGQMEAVENRDWQHGTMTLRHMTMKAAEANLQILSKRCGTTVYMWLVPAQGGKADDKG